MTKEAYIGELRSYLGRLPLNEREAALVYYIEYFEERGDDEAASQELGPPREAAAKIIADYEEQASRTGKPSRGGSLSVGCFMGVILVLSFPLWFSLLVTLGAVVFSLAVAGFVLLAAGFYTMATSIPSGICALGAALFCIGLLVLVCCGVYWVLARGIPSLWHWMVNKKKEAEQ